MIRKEYFHSMLLAAALTAAFTGISSMPVHADETTETVAQTDAENSDEFFDSTEFYAVEQFSVEDTVEYVEPESDVAGDLAESSAVMSETAEAVATENAGNTEATARENAEDKENATSENTGNEETVVSETSKDNSETTKDAEAEAEPEKSVSEQEQTEETSDSDVSQDDQNEKRFYNWFDDEDLAINGLTTVTISLNADGSLAADAANASGESVDGTDLKGYSMSYVIPSSWTQQEQDDFRKIMESYAGYALEKSPDNPNALVCSGVKYQTESDAPQLTDAEKYNNPADQTNPDTFDRNHCWAAQASNMLWSSGWAAQATNPLTGNKFASEDEVMTYFSSCFTDQGYYGIYGVSWFFDGQYLPVPDPSPAYTANREEVFEEENTLDGTGESGLLTDYDTNKAVNGKDFGTAEILIDNYKHYFDQILEDGFENNYYGVDIAIYVNEYVTRNSEAEDYVPGDPNTWIRINGHALTLTGLVYDDTATDFSEKYLAILVADSDNDAYTKELNTKPENAEEATTAKSGCTNSYTLYELKTARQTLKQTMNSEGSLSDFLYLPGYLYGQFDSSYCFMAVLTVGYSMIGCTDQTMTDYAVASDPTPEQADQTDSGTETEEESSNMEYNAAASNTEYNAAAPDKEVNDSFASQHYCREAFCNYRKNHESYEKSYILRGACAYDKDIWFSSYYESGKNWQYLFLSSLSEKMIGEITLDGKKLDTKEYKIVPCDDNTCKIVFSPEFMQKLTVGEHVFMISCEGFDQPFRMIVTVTE